MQHPNKIYTKNPHPQIANQTANTQNFNYPYILLTKSNFGLILKRDPNKRYSISYSHN